MGTSVFNLRGTIISVKSLRNMLCKKTVYERRKEPDLDWREREGISGEKTPELRAEG
jgi:hypothetical protein